jgi:hypothetical protein
MFDQKKKRKLLIVINYYSGDRDMARKLGELIADLEPGTNEKADIAFHRRFDAEQMPNLVKDKLLSKFSKVLEFKCRRMNAVGYPFGPNEMFYDILERLGNRDWQLEYYAFLNLEADCCPLAPEWIDKMIESYEEAWNSGKSAAGHVCQDPVKVHLNGVAIYSTDFWHKAGAMNIIGGPANIAYDVHHAERVLPISIDTTNILLDFNRKTISAEDLDLINKHGKRPYLLHGVKDSSAFIHVRNKYCGGGSNGVPIRLKTVFTYFDICAEYNQEEQKRQIDVWKHVWSAYGYNPIVLTEWDASKNPVYAKIKPKLATLKGTHSRKKELASIYRWLALENVGGGLYLEYDVLPGQSFTSDDVPTPDGVIALEAKGMAAVSADRQGLRCFSEVIENFDYANAQTVPTDADILAKEDSPFWLKKEQRCVNWNTQRWPESKLVHFSLAACKTVSANPHKPSIIEQHLKTLKP